MSEVMFSTSPPASVRKPEPIAPAKPKLRTLLPTTISPGTKPFSWRQKISLPESEQTYTRRTISPDPPKLANLGERQRNHERGAPPRLTLEADVAAVLVDDDRVADGQALTG